jgi:large conductance mechanosensitive channel
MAHQGRSQMLSPFIFEFPAQEYGAYNSRDTLFINMNIKEILGEFKSFVTKGNVVDLAVGVLIGAAFGDVVKAFTTGIVNPLISAVGGNTKVSLHLWIFDVGALINALIGFLITAAILFFIFVKPMNKLKALTDKKVDVEPTPIPADVQLLAEIRDLLKAQAKPVA